MKRLFLYGILVALCGCSTEGYENISTENVQIERIHKYPHLRINYQLDKVTIDGKEFLIAVTYDGVAIYPLEK